MPGFHLTLSFVDAKFLENASRAQTGVYPTAALFSIASIVASAVVVGVTIRRQMLLAGFKNDLVAVGAMNYARRWPQASC